MFLTYYSSFTLIIFSFIISIISSYYPVYIDHINCHTISICSIPILFLSIIPLKNIVFLCVSIVVMGEKIIKLFKKQRLQHTLGTKNNNSSLCSIYCKYFILSKFLLQSGVYFGSEFFFRPGKLNISICHMYDIFDSNISYICIHFIFWIRLGWHDLLIYQHQVFF